MAEIDDELKSVPDSDTPDHFAQTGADYAKYRPGYSERVFDDLLFILKISPPLRDMEAKG